MACDKMDFLLQKGCNQGQGYLFSRPLPPLGIEELVKKKTCPTNLCIFHPG